VFIMAFHPEFPILVGLFTLAAAAVDLYMRRVPNYLTVPAALIGLAYHAVAPGGQGLLFALAGFAIGFLLLLLPWILGGGGMGDVKLLAALGMWLGPLFILVAFGGSALIAAATAMVVMAINTLQHGIMSTRRRYLAVGQSGNVSLHEEPLHNAKKRRVLPFAVPVAMSTWLVLAWMLLNSTH
jgi:prepilin peptidase CpaA